MCILLFKKVYVCHKDKPDREKSNRNVPIFHF